MSALAKAAQQAGILSQAQQSLTLSQRSVYGRLKAAGIPDAVARQLAIALEKSEKRALGAAFSHARASGKDQSKQARKRRAQDWLRREGRTTMGKGMALAKKAFVEADHPRNKVGEWSEGGEGGGGGEKSGSASTKGADTIGPVTAATKANPAGPTMGKKAATDDEKEQAIRSYGNFGYRDINQAARDYDSGKKPADKYEKKGRVEAEALSQAIHDQTLEKDMTLYRGLKLPRDVEVGQTLAGNGFTSASTKKSVANGFAQATDSDATHERAVVTIRAPKGINALDMARSNANANKSEKEYVFDHRQRFKVVEDKGRDSKGVRQLVIEPVQAVTKSVMLAKAAYHRAFVDGAKASLESPVYDALRLAARAKAGGKASGLKRRASNDENKQALMAQRDQLKESLRAVEVELAKMAPVPDEVAADEFIAPKAKRKRTLAERAMDAACKQQAQPVTKSHHVTIVKAEERPWQKIVHSVVYEPDVPDTDDDFMTAEDIEKMAHAAMKGGVLINHEHTPTDVGAHVVESYIAPADFTVHGPDGAAHAIRKGSWVMGLQVTNDETWGRILSGEYGGFSMEGSALRLGSA